METDDKPQRHFDHPPIVEAVLALSIDPMPEEMLKVLDGCAEAMKDLGYDQGESVIQHQMSMKVEAGISVAASLDRRVGLRYLSFDRNYAVQFNLNGMVFSRIGNYDRWETFRSEARSIWKVFASAIALEAIIGVGVRYINKVFVPVGRPAEEYVRVYPEIPSEVAPQIDGMFMRLVLPLAEPAGALIHTQMLLPPERAGFATLLLDNDFQFPTPRCTSDKAWELIEQVRDIKNSYFESFVTDALRRTFDA